MVRAKYQISPPSSGSLKYSKTGTMKGVTRTKNGIIYRNL